MKFRKMHLYSKWTFQYFCGSHWIYTLINRDFYFKRCYFKILLFHWNGHFYQNKIVSLWFTAVNFFFFFWQRNCKLLPNLYVLKPQKHSHLLHVCRSNFAYRGSFWKGAANSHFILFFLIVVDLQCCASFRCTGQWFGYIYIHF